MKIEFDTDTVSVIDMKNIINILNEKHIISFFTDPNKVHFISDIYAEKIEIEEGKFSQYIRISLMSRTNMIKAMKEEREKLK